MAFATVDQVLYWTGIFITDEVTLRKAEMDIAIVTGLSPVDFDPDDFDNVDLDFLMLATAAQAVRYNNGDGNTFSQDITNISQDGLSLNLTETGVILDPRAKWAIQQLSWMKARVIPGRSSAGYGDFINNACVASPVGWRQM